MRFVSIVVFAFISSVSMAQDLEFPDYRSKKDNFVKIREKDIRNDVSIFTIAGIDESMGKLPLKNVPMKEYGNNFMTFEQNDIKVKVTRGVFDPSKHKLGYFDEKHLVKIDNKPFYGNYGKVPKFTVESISVIMGKDTVQIPTGAYADLYNPSFGYIDASGTERSLNAVFLSPDNRNVYIYMLNREPSGSYEVTWVIQDKKYLRRVVDYGLLQ